MSATRIFSKFKELLDVSWASVSEGAYLKRSGANIVGAAAAEGPPGPAGPAGPVGAAQVWRGEYSPATLYSANDAVGYNGSSFVATQSTIGVAPVPQTIPLIPPLATTGSRGSIAALPPSNQTSYYARGDNTWQILPQTTYVVGPANSAAGDLATYADTTGKLLGAVSILSKMPPGSIIQTIYSEYTANANLTALMSYADTVPTWTQGTEIFAPTIVPFFPTSKILATFECEFCNNSGPGHGYCALFRDFGVPSAFPNAIAARMAIYNTTANNHASPMSLRYLDSPATTNLTTYRIRIGPDAHPPMRLNGTATQRMLGGSQRATFVIQEIRQ